MYTYFEKQKSENHQALILKKLLNLSIIYKADYILSTGLNLLRKNLPTMQDEILVGTLLVALYYADLQDSEAHYGIEVINEKIELIKIQYPTQDMLQCEHIILIIGQKALQEKQIPFEGAFSENQEIQSIISQTLGEVKNCYFESYGILKPMHAVEDEIDSNFKLI